MFRFRFSCPVLETPNYETIVNLSSAAGHSINWLDTVDIQGPVQTTSSIFTIFLRFDWLRRLLPHIDHSVFSALFRYSALFWDHSIYIISIVCFCLYDDATAKINSNGFCSMYRSCINIQDLWARRPENLNEWKRNFYVCWRYIYTDTHIKHNIFICVLVGWFMQMCMLCTYHRHTCFMDSYMENSTITDISTLSAEQKKNNNRWSNLTENGNMNEILWMCFVCACVCVLCTDDPIIRNWSNG